MPVPMRYGFLLTRWTAAILRGIRQNSARASALGHERRAGATSNAVSRGGASHASRAALEAERRRREAGLDDTLAQTFPASDPPSSIPNPLLSE
jgi:hypothetical protein